MYEVLHHQGQLTSLGLHYDQLHSQKGGHCHVSIREQGAMATGLRFVNWVHHDHGDDARAEPPPQAIVAAYGRIEHWLPAEHDQRDNILVVTRRTSAQSLQSFFQQSRRRANAETAQGGWWCGQALYCPTW